MNAVQMAVISGILCAGCFQELSAGAYFGIPTLFSIQGVVLVARKSFNERKSYNDSMRSILWQSTTYYTISLSVCLSRNAFSPEHRLFLMVFTVLHLLVVYLIGKQLLKRSIEFGQTIEPFRSRLDRIEHNIQRKSDALAVDREHRLKTLKCLKENLYNLSPYSKSAIESFLKKQESTYKSLEEWALHAS